MASENGVHVNELNLNASILVMEDGAKYKAVQASCKNACKSCALQHEDCHLVLCPPNGFAWEKMENKSANQPHEEPKWINDVRSHNVGDSDYSKHEIQPWDIWLEYYLNPWEADIVKRVIRRKESQDRRGDFSKIKHICEELIRQIDAGKYVDYKKLVEENKRLKELVG